MAWSVTILVVFPGESRNQIWCGLDITVSGLGTAGAFDAPEECMVPPVAVTVTGV